MEILNRAELQQNIIPAIAEAMRPKIYVELGIRTCETFNRVAPFCGRAIGVDRNNCAHCITVHNGEFHHMSSKDFALEWREPIDLLFIDADHHFEAAMWDFETFAQHVVLHGVICVHDTFLGNAASYESTLDSYRVAEAIRTREDLAHFEAVTIPVPPGLTIVRKNLGQQLRAEVANDLRDKGLA